MKNKLIILLSAVFGILIFTTCQKEPKLPMPDLQKSVIPKVTKDATKDQNISFFDLPGFVAAVKVDLYYEDKPKSMNLMVCMNDDVENSGLIKENITTFPTTSADITIGTLVDVLPGLESLNDIVLGDYFRFYVDITLEDGTVIHGNDTLYASFDPAVANLPGSSLNVVYTVACELDPALTVGSYYSYSAPSDWNSAGDITITADPVDPNTVYVAGLETNDGLDEDQGPLVMHIDPITYVVTADKTVLASDAWGYHNIAYAGTGTYNTCTGLYKMKFTISVDEGDFGEFVFTFTRN
jgi:hypothetical protein